HPVAGLLHLLLYRIGDRHHLAIGAARGEDEVIGVAGEPSDIEDHHLFCLLVQGRLGSLLGRGEGRCILGRRPTLIYVSGGYLPCSTSAWGQFRSLLPAPRGALSLYHMRESIR